MAEITDLTVAVIEDGTVEICRSFAYKLNVGNYESRDFFCSQKGQCRKDQADKVSDDLFDFCVESVLRSVKAYKVKMKSQGRDVD